MLTYEKVLEIFEDYLEQDKEIEVLVSRRGHVLIEWAGSFDFLDGGNRYCPAGGGGAGYILPQERNHPAGNRVPGKPGGDSDGGGMADR